MRTGKAMAMLGGALLAASAIAAPSVEITAVQQQYPWTNTVDITYEVQGVTNMEYFVRFTPTTSDDDPILNVEGEASIQVALESNGVFTAQWYPQTNLQYTACKMTPAIFRGGSGGGNDYMIVDLETGAVTYEPMATQEASNERYQATAYKTRYLVLRRIAADDYYIGEENNTGNVNQAPNTYHKVNIPQDYYMAIYELTVAQYNYITGEGTDFTSTYNRDNKSWNDTRGSALTAAIPTKGVMADLNRKTGLRGFDLPTESMFEIAARAGSKDLYLSGNTTAGLSDYAQIASRALPVGSLKPNAWGFYDVVGNGWEFVRDVWNSGNLDALQPNGLVPITTGSPSYCAYRSSSYYYNGSQTSTYRLSIRHGDTKTWKHSSGGSAIRVSYFPQ